MTRLVNKRGREPGDNAKSIVQNDKSTQEPGDQQTRVITETSAVTTQPAFIIGANPVTNPIQIIHKTSGDSPGSNPGCKSASGHRNRQQQHRRYQRLQQYLNDKPRRDPTNEPRPIKLASRPRTYYRNNFEQRQSNCL